jgi:hypothetical protein
MIILNKSPKVVAALALAGLVVSMFAYGCASNKFLTDAAGNAPAVDVPANDSPKFALFGPPPKQSGVELWSDNCARCHNMRPPNEFSAAQWETIVHHMRLRANLTGEEAREITQFLQASH